VKISLGTFACTEVEAYSGSDLSAGVRAALSDYMRRLASGTPPIAIPRLMREAAPVQPAKILDLPIDEETWEALEHEAARQDASVSELAAHSVLLYLAEIDRLTPPATA
jgi:hypothetical protein